MDARALVDHLREHVQIGLGQRRELAPALDLGHDLVLGADRLQDAGVGREAGLAAALARQAELLEQDLPQLLRRGDQELLVGEREDLRFQRGELLAHAARDLRQALEVQAHAEQLHLAQDGHERQLDVAHHPLEAALGDLLALPGGQRAEQHRVGGRGVLEVARQAALFAQLGERVAAPRRLEQVGAQQRVVGEPRRHEPERLGVVREQRALAARRDDLLGPLAVAGQHLDGACPRVAVLPAAIACGRDGHGEAPRGTLGEQRAVGRLGGHERRATAPPRRHPAARCRRRSRAHTGAQPDLGGGRRRCHLGVTERLLQALERVAQLVLAEHLAHARAVGLARRLGRDVEVDRDVALHGGQAL